MSSFSQLLKQTKTATAFTRVALKSCHQTSHCTHLVIESILAWISLSIASEFVTPAFSNFSKHCWVSCTSRFVWWYRGSITPSIWMQNTLYKLSGVHMLLPSGGDIQEICVTCSFTPCHPPSNLNDQLRSHSRTKSFSKRVSK